jgi:hypothetical protein
MWSWLVWQPRGYSAYELQMRPIMMATLLNSGCELDYSPLSLHLFVRTSVGDTYVGS